MAKFKVGDKIRAIDNHYYVTTLDNEWVGRVISINYKENIRVETISCKAEGKSKAYNVDEEHFEKIAEKEEKKLVLEKIKRYVINENATIIFWEDGDKTIVKRCSDEPFKKELGFLYAYFQKTSGLSKTKANKFIKELKVTKPKEKKKKKKDNSQLEENIKFFQEVTDVVPEITRESKFNLGDIVNVRYDKNKLNYSEIKEIYGNEDIEVYRDKRINRVQIRYKIYAKKFYNGEWTYIIQSRVGKKKYFALKETALRRVYA